MKRILALGMVVITLISLGALPISADSMVIDAERIIVDQTVKPLLENGRACNTSFVITSSGLAIVNVSYEGLQGVTTKVTAKVYLQKKTLGLFWTRVDIGTTNDEWVNSSTNHIGMFENSYQLKSTGTYRAVIEITISGTGGSDDVIEQKIEKKYS